MQQKLLSETTWPWEPFHVHLYQPDIPQNTGNIGRLCVSSDSHLHIVGPIGFSLDTKAVRRAGLDYWPYLNWTYLESAEEWEAQLPSRFFLVTKFGQKSLYETPFQPGDHFVFGCETSGLPKALLEKYPEKTLYIPMSPNCRSINLANAVSIVVYEALRQQIQHFSEKKDLNQIQE